MTFNVHHVAEHIYTIPGLLSGEECISFISKSETIGYEPATVDTEKGPRRLDEVRNNDRIIHYDTDLAENLWARLSGLVPQRLGNSRVVGLNECFRFYRYFPGQQFRKHRDQSFIRNEVEASYYTLLIYLNDDHGGGSTRFNSVSISPEAGKALIFLHDLEHEGEPVASGIKYVLRTDIMYRLE